METISRGTGGDCNELQRRYELSVYLDIRHLGSLCTTYLKIYGEELTDYKLHRLVADLLLGVFSQTTSVNRIAGYPLIFPMVFSSFNGLKKKRGKHSSSVYRYGVNMSLRVWS